MNEIAYVMSDIHGMAQAFDTLLQYWNPDTEQLILLGDYIDRGPSARTVLLRIYELAQQANVTVLRGNHEQMLINYTRDPIRYTDHYHINGGAATIADLLNIEPQEVLKENAELLAAQIREKYPDLLAWLESLPVYTEFGNFVLAHAGADIRLADWRDSTERDFIWIRDEFHEAENHTGRQFIFGHTPTMYFDCTNDIWQSSDGKIGIDGGAVYGNSLIGIKINHQDVLSKYIYSINEERVIHD